MKYVRKKRWDDIKKYQLLLACSKMKIECRNEKLFMFFVLYYSFLRFDEDLENMSFI